MNRPNGSRRIVALACAAAALGAMVKITLSAAPSGGAPQQPLPGFRAGTDLVQVDVSVLDGHRVPVKGLTAADFTVLENGKPRDVAAFAEVDLPSRTTSNDAAWTRDVPPDVTTNEIGSAGGRILVILMDRKIPAMGPASEMAKRAATAAVNALGPGDLGAFISTSGAVPQNLTADRTRLLAAINQRADWSTDPSDDAQAVEAAIGVGPTGPFSPLMDGRCLCGLCVLETITNVATALEQMSRQRKTLLFIGADITFQAVSDVLDCGHRLVEARDVMHAALDRSGVIIHSIDPTGLQQTGSMGNASSPLRGVDVQQSFQDGLTNRMKRQGNLEVLPARTGGRVVTNTNAPEEFVPAIVRESEAYYVIGYRPVDPQIPGQARRIEVKVNRRGVHVAARREYVVPSPPSAPQGDHVRADLGSAIRSTLPVADSPLEITASSFGLPGKPAAVAVTLDVSSFARYAVPSSGAPAPLTIAVAAYDAWGRPEGASDVIAVTDLRAPRAGRLEAISRLDLRPGDHEVRAAVTAEGTGHVASVFTHITVPPFADNPLTLSQVAIAASAATDTIQRQRLADVVPIVPTTAREFSRAEPATAFMQVYQGLARTQAIQPVSLTVSVIDRAGTTRVKEALTLSVASFDEHRTADCRFTLPVSRLDPGEYVLTIEAHAGARQAGRAVRFGVR